MTTTRTRPAFAIREVESDARRVHGLKKLLQLAEAMELEGEVDALRRDVAEFDRELAESIREATAEGWTADDVADACDRAGHVMARRAAKVVR